MEISVNKVFRGRNPSQIKRTIKIVDVSDLGVHAIVLTDSKGEEPVSERHTLIRLDTFVERYVPEDCPPKPITPPIVTLKAIFEKLADTHTLTENVGEMMADFVTEVILHLQNGSRIQMSGIGTLEVRKLKARAGRNPATGEAIQIKASKKVKFRPAKELKEAVCEVPRFLQS